MPAKRLPWFKMWPEAQRHEKVVLLSDPVFRSWVLSLAAGSEQAVRWRFASVRHAASVIGRPVKHITELITARLLDEHENGEVWIHNWRKWQLRHPSDFGAETDDEDDANAPRTLPERSLKSEPPLRERREERGEKRETEREVEPEPNVSGELVVAVTGGAGGAADAALGADAPPTTAAAKGQAEILRGLSEDARAVLAHHREQHGKRLLAKLTPEAARSLEEAVADLGVDRLRESITYMARKIPAVPELSKAITAAKTKRRNDESSRASPPSQNGHTALESRDASRYLETRRGPLTSR